MFCAVWQEQTLPNGPDELQRLVNGRAFWIGQTCQQWTRAPPNWNCILWKCNEINSDYIRIYGRLTLMVSNNISSASVTEPWDPWTGATLRFPVERNLRTWGANRSGLIARWVSSVLLRPDCIVKAVVWRQESDWEYESLDGPAEAASGTAIPRYTKWRMLNAEPDASLLQASPLPPFVAVDSALDIVLKIHIVGFDRMFGRCRPLHSIEHWMQMQQLDVLILR